MSWLNVNLNESLSSIKGQLTNLASNVLAETIDDVTESCNGDVIELQKRISDQEIEIKRLQNENNEISKRIQNSEAGEDWSWDIRESKTDIRSLDDNEMELKIRDLERERSELVLSLEQLDADCQSTTDKLVAMKDELQSENSGLKLQYQDLNKENGFLRSSLEQERQRIKMLEYKQISRDEEIQRLREEIERYRNLADSSDTSVSVFSAEEHLHLETVVAECNKKISAYEMELATLRDSKHGDVNMFDSMNSLVHETYCEILIKEMTKIDFNMDRWSLVVGADGESGEVGDIKDLEMFKKLVQFIGKGMVDWRWKCESAEEEKKNIAAEKSLLMTEKEHEADKLNMTIQELTMSRTEKNNELKHFEDECAELSHNNERLLAELEQLRQADMALHTIPEMNEHFDGQLEKCYKRIEQLESQVEMKRSEHMQDVLDQLQVAEKEMELMKVRAQEWQVKFEKLEDENVSLKVYLESMRDRFKECDTERVELEDQVKLDNESMAEQNLNLETLQEETEILAAQIIELRNENAKLTAGREELEVKLEEAAKEINDLKEGITNELERSLKKDQQMSDLNITVDCMEKNILKLKFQVERLSNENEELVRTRSKYIMDYRNFKRDVEDLIVSYKDLKFYQISDAAGYQELIREKNQLLQRLSQMEEHQLHNSVLNEKLETMEKQHEVLRKERDDVNALIAEKTKLQTQMEELNKSRNEIIQLVQQKHQESMNYHAEIQRLQQLLTVEAEKRKTFESQLAELNGSCVAPEDLQQKEKEIEKLTEQQEFLKEKCAKMADTILQEQAERNAHQERETNFKRQLESLRQHLIDVEEMYTKEIQAAETKCSEMQEKMQTIVEKEKNSNNRFTSANIRANQQVETLQTNLQLVTNQRDVLKRKTSGLEDTIEKQNAALCNLQIVLEQFQREKDKVIFEETERVRRQIAVEKKTQEELMLTINDLKSQLAESKEGLKAAVRLSDQVETSKRQVLTLKDEATKLHLQLLKAEEKNLKLLNQTDGRVDKMLVKNLVIGLVTCSSALNKDQNQILKIISTVLDFNQQDIERVNLNKKDQSTWFSSLLHPQALADRNISSDSLSLAFVKFLEAESKPRSLPNLLDAATSSIATNSAAATIDGGSSGSSRRTSVRQSPLLLNEVVLPTFADFAANRNSSSILKDVLKDNSNIS